MLSYIYFLQFSWNQLYIPCSDAVVYSQSTSLYCVYICKFHYTELLEAIAVKSILVFSWLQLGVICQCRIITFPTLMGCDCCMVFCAYMIDNLIINNC